MSTTKHPAVLAFLDDLRAVYAKHGLRVSACGCCYGPKVGRLDDIDAAIEHLADPEDSESWGGDEDFYADLVAGEAAA